MFKKILTESAKIDLPKYYKTDLEADRRTLDEYTGKTFLYIFRERGTQLCLLYTYDMNYFSRKLNEWAFYKSDKSARFYFFNGLAFNEVPADEAIGILERAIVYRQLHPKNKIYAEA